MRYLEIIEFTPPTGKEYSAESYPGLGMFVDKFESLRFVYKSAGSTVACVLDISGLLTKVKDDTAPVEFVQSVVTPTGLSMNDLLKAIAVPQKPELAKELTQ